MQNISHLPIPKLVQNIWIVAPCLVWLEWNANRPGMTKSSRKCHKMKVEWGWCEREWVAVDPQHSSLARLINHTMIMINKQSCIAGSMERPTENLKACLDSCTSGYTTAQKTNKAITRGSKKKGIITWDSTLSIKRTDCLHCAPIRQLKGLIRSCICTYICT